jgi:hydroxymethylpyrimidine pyrophosphatase-like HAD family hydrolase/HD superfamily phosphodiesterase
MPSTYCQPESGLDLDVLESLFAQNMPRLAHMRDACAFACDLRASFGISDAQGALLKRSALLHDIGYAPALRRFGYHPLDGALFLAERDEHPWIVEGVLRHSQADRKCGMVCGAAAEYALRPQLPDADWLVRAVTIADWRAAGVGSRVSFARRFQDIAQRNPHNPEKIRRAGIMVSEVRDWFLEWAEEMAANRPLPWVFCDVDNTLIRPGDSLSTENMTAIKAYTAAGGSFSLATGKHPLSIAPLALQLGLTSAQITANGTCLLDQGEVTVLADLGEAAQMLRTALENLGLPIALYRKDGIEAGGTWEGSLDDVFDRYGEIRPVRGVQSGPVLKILCITNGADLKRDGELRLLAAELGVDCCRSDRHFLEFLPLSGNKGQAARSVMQNSAWPVLHSLAIGDTENDEPLFALCGGCAAVGNASEEARLGADWTIGHCDAGGVGAFLDHLRRSGGWAGLRSNRVI